MEQGRIPNSRITASTFYGSGHEPWRARLNNYPIMPYKTWVDIAAWSAKLNQPGQWLQVDLGKEKFVTKVATQGRAFKYIQWVTSYKLVFSQDQTYWRTYQEQGLDVVSYFVGFRGCRQISRMHLYVHWILRLGFEENW